MLVAIGCGEGALGAGTRHGDDTESALQNAMNRAFCGKTSAFYSLSKAASAADLLAYP
jgi:hypothetical protein